MRQLREYGDYLRPASGARATIRRIFTGRTFSGGELFIHNRCALDGQLGLFRAGGIGENPGTGGQRGFRRRERLRRLGLVRVKPAAGSPGFP